MKIHEQKNKPSYSFEVFPPKRDGSKEQIYSTLDEIVKYSPDFISVTYGASGSSRGNETIDICSDIKNSYNIEPLMHLTCANSSKADIDRILEDIKSRNIKNTLLMRGDKQDGIPEEEQFKDFKYASDLIAYASSKYDLSIGGACYPEGHIGAKSLVSDLINIKKKVDAGANFLISQFFFDNEMFYNFVKEARNLDISVPIYAGIMPVLNKNQIHRMVALSGASLPEKFKKILDRYEFNPSALQDAGIAYASEQIVDLLSSDVDGIHLYVMNKPEIAKRISENIGSILKDRKQNHSDKG